jgi:hypothetical protein
MSDEEKEGRGFTVKDRRLFSPEREEDAQRERSKEKQPPGDRAEPSEGAKESKRREREEPDSKEIPLPEPSFSTFLTFFFFQQAIMFLGELPHPETQQVTKNLPMAKYLIDTMAIIKEKTKGNLTSEEQSQLDAFLTELRMRYVKAAGV